MDSPIDARADLSKHPHQNSRTGQSDQIQECLIVSLTVKNVMLCVPMIDDVVTDVSNRGACCPLAWRDSYIKR